MRWKRRRWHSRTTKKASRKKTLFFALIIMFVCSTCSFFYVDQQITPKLMDIANVRLKQIATESINQSISNEVSSVMNYDQMVNWKTNDSGKITGFMLNYAEHLKITAKTQKVVQATLDRLQRVPEHIPLGQAVGSTLLAAITPNIPVHYYPAGSVKVDLGTREKDAAINMLLIEVYIRVTVDVAIIIPFETKSTVVQTEVPISYILVSGDVPMYYFDGSGKPLQSNTNSVMPPSISIPGEIGQFPHNAPAR